MSYKQGFKTTEFWLTLASLIITTGLTLAGEIKDINMLLTNALTIAAYTLSRTAVKNGRVGGEVDGSSFRPEDD